MCNACIRLSKTQYGTVAYSTAQYSENHNTHIVLAHIGRSRQTNGIRRWHTQTFCFTLHTHILCGCESTKLNSRIDKKKMFFGYFSMRMFVCLYWTENKGHFFVNWTHNSCSSSCTVYAHALLNCWTLTNAIHSTDDDNSDGGGGGGSDDAADENNNDANRLLQLKSRAYIRWTLMVLSVNLCTYCTNRADI